MAGASEEEGHTNKLEAIENRANQRACPNTTGNQYPIGRTRVRRAAVMINEAIYRRCDRCAIH